jgi:hypothetical protein
MELTSTKPVTIKQIIITWGEGLIELSGSSSYEVKSWKEARSILRNMAASVFTEGSLKTDFEVYFSEGSQYKGCYDLRVSDIFYGDIFDHIKLECDFYMGKNRPDHFTSEEQYINFIMDDREEFTKFYEETLMPSWKAEYPESPSSEDSDISIVAYVVARHVIPRCLPTLHPLYERREMGWYTLTEKGKVLYKKHQHEIEHLVQTVHAPALEIWNRISKIMNQPNF